MRCVRSERFKYIRNYMPEIGYEVCNYTKTAHPEWTEAKKLYEEGKLNEIKSLMFADNKPREELYDTVNDPFETINLAGTNGYRIVLERLRGVLDKWIIEVKDQVLAGTLSIYLCNSVRFD